MESESQLKFWQRRSVAENLVLERLGGKLPRSAVRPLMGEELEDFFTSVDRFLEEESFLAGETVINQGEFGDKLYVIEEGTVLFSVDGLPVGEQTTGIFGDLSLIYGMRRTAKAVCGTDCLLWSLGLVHFLRTRSLKFSFSQGFKPFRRKPPSKFSLGDANAAGTLSESSILQLPTWRRAGVDFSRLKDISLLGQEGDFGSVSLVRDKDSGRYYALKQLFKATNAGKRARARVMTALSALRECSSPCVIELYDFHQDRDCVFFLTDFVQGGDLMSYMIAQGTLADPVARFLSACLAEGIHHLHQRGFIHRDIKPDNCLIGMNGYLKLSGFELVRRLPGVVELWDGRTEFSLAAYTMCGTPEFMAPEFCLSEGYDQGADWWAFGCVLFEMYMGRNPFDVGNLKTTYEEIDMIGRGKPTVSIHPTFIQVLGDAANMISRCITRQRDRIGKNYIEDIEAHPYFQDINFADLRAGIAPAPYLPIVTGEDDIFHFYELVKNLEREPVPVYDGDDEWADFS